MGVSSTRLYSLWIHMRQRCNYEKDANYEYYGARGIRVCSEWENNFDSFKIWALNNGYSEKPNDRGVNTVTIDRIDVNGDYCPENCRFVDSKIQSRNRRSNVNVEFNGKVITLIELSEITKFPYKTIRDRWTRGERDVDRLIRPLADQKDRNHRLGEKHHSSKLTESDVREIRALHENNYTNKRIAEIYSLDPSSVRAIIIRKTWKHVI